MISEEQEKKNTFKPYERKEFISDRESKTVSKMYSDGNMKGGELSYDEYIKEEAELDTKNELIRSAMRIQQSRE